MREYKQQLNGGASDTARYARGHVRASMFVSGSMIAVALSAGSALAQTTPAEPGAQELVVTGTRITREGYEAPTPLSVVGTDLLESQAAPNIASVLGTLPQFSNNLTPARAANLPSGGLTGINSVSIRGLGPNRSLVLLDGQRFVPVLTFGTSAATMAVDITNIPEQLIERVDIVTGGASAVYGSDAVGGVTNFILNKTFTGLKAEISGGQTAYGDGQNYRIALSGGFRFAGDRGHVLLSVFAQGKDGVHDTTNRAWDANRNCVMNNPAWTATNGQPRRVTTPNCTAVSARGGVVMDGPLRGTAFGPGGATYPYTFGAIAGNTMIGGSTAGDVKQTDGNSLDPDEDRRNVFGRLSYKLSDDVSVAVTSSYSESQSFAQAMTLYRFGPSGGLAGPLIRPDNAFIPVQLRAAVAGTAGFRVNTANADMPLLSGTTDRSVMRNSIQFDGRFDLWGSDWTWNAYYQHGISKNSIRAPSQVQARYVEATDAVFNSLGQIVCRSTLTNPNNGCVPFNPMGEGVNSQAAINYLASVGELDQSNTQQVAAASISGDLPFGLAAGPISIALDAAYRVESASGTADPGALANAYWGGNYKPVNGRDTVTEAAVEFAIPVLKDLPFAKSLDVSLAARAANYNSSGFVATWKAGATYTPISDITFRGNISRDIRAGNLGELFADTPTLINNPNVLDPFTQQQFNIRSGVRGNLNLTPEIANSYGFGTVLSPSFIPGLNISADYWRIRIKDEIVPLNNNAALQLCFEGNQQACGFITRSGPANIPGAAGSPFAGQSFAALDTITPGYFNLASSVTQGVDLSASWRVNLADISPGLGGTLTARWNHTFFLRGSSDPGLPGSNINRTDTSWRSIFNLFYNNGPWAGGLGARFAPKNQFTFTNDPQVIECQSACPLISTLPANITTQNFVYREASAFVDANLAYSFTIGSSQVQAFINVRNLLNRDPVLVPPTQPWTVHQSIGGDDALGRLTRIGLRLQM